MKNICRLTLFGLSILALLFFRLGSEQPTWAAVPIKVPTPEVETLSNGLKLVWFLNENLPMIDLSLLVQTGFREDPMGKSGTAELLSNLLDRGAAGMSAQKFGRAIEMLGGVRYKVAEDDFFSIGLHGLAPDANDFLGLLAQMTIRPDLLQKEIQLEREKLKSRWEHLGDTGEALAALVYNRLITAGTSYGRGSLFSLKEMEGITRGDLIQFHKKYFTPQNSILMIVGRVNKVIFRQKVQEFFGDWKGENSGNEGVIKTIRRNYSDSRLLSGHLRGDSSILVVDRPDLPQAQIKIGFRAPLMLVPEHEALMVFNTLFGESMNSRLNSMIRDKLGLTYAISSSYSYRKEFADFSISASTRNEMVGQLIRKTEDLLKDLQKGPILQEEVDAAKNYLKGGFPLNNSDLNSVASHWLTSFFYGFDPGYLNDFVRRVDAVTLKDVQSAVAKSIDLKNLVIVVAGDFKVIKNNLKSIPLKSFKQVAVKDLK